LKPTTDKARRVIKRQNLASTLVDDLRKRIISGEFPGGTMLRQAQLADEYGVSRMPVREALHQLDAEGLVETIANKGALVTELSLAEIDEIFDIRATLEPDLLARAIPNITQDAIDEIQAVLHELDEAYQTRDVEHWGTLNAKFHISLYKPSGRSISLSFIHRISLQVDRYIRIQLVMTNAMTDGAEDHLQLFELAKAGETKKAVALLNTHIQRTKEQLLAILAARKH